jgi:hypothetical protein
MIGNFGLLKIHARRGLDVVILLVGGIKSCVLKNERIGEKKNQFGRRHVQPV